MSGLCEYVDVRARDHVNMKCLLRSQSTQRNDTTQFTLPLGLMLCINVHRSRYYLPRFPGLVHFIFVDVESCEFYSPRLSSLTAASLKGTPAEAAALAGLREEVWRMVAEAREYVSRGHAVHRAW